MKLINKNNTMRTRKIREYVFVGSSNTNKYRNLTTTRLKEISRKNPMLIKSLQISL